jgi:hypothetical protein
VEVTRREDVPSEVFLYGEYVPSAQAFAIDAKRLERLRELEVEGFSACRSRFARLQRAGDCLAKAPDVKRLSEVRNEYRCTVNRYVTSHQLLNQLRSARPRKAAEATVPGLLEKQDEQAQ